MVWNECVSFLFSNYFLCLIYEQAKVVTMTDKYYQFLKDYSTSVSLKGQEEIQKHQYELRFSAGILIDFERT
jgi:hypothetical protein